MNHCIYCEPKVKMIRIEQDNTSNQDMYVCARCPTCGEEYSKAVEKDTSNVDVLVQSKRPARK